MPQSIPIDVVLGLAKQHKQVLSFIACNPLTEVARRNGIDEAQWATIQRRAKATLRRAA